MIAIAFSFLPKIFAFLWPYQYGLSVALTFYKINNRPFIFVLESFFKYLIRKTFYLKMPRGNKASVETLPNRQIILPKVSQSKLKDLTWDLSVRAKSIRIMKTTRKKTFSAV